MSAQDFGANDWLVDEMYEHYLADPSSVDPAWIEYFKINKPGTPAAVPTTSQSSQPVSKGVPPVPKAQKQTPVVEPQVVTQPVAAVVPPAPVAEARVKVPVAQAPVQQPIVKVWLSE